MGAVEKLIEKKTGGLWFIEKESREKKRNEKKEMKSTNVLNENILPQYATTISCISSQNPLFNYVELKENALMPFGGALFETSILANNFLTSYWPLSSDFIGVDWSNSGQHLSL